MHHAPGYRCTAATVLFSGSLGRYASQLCAASLQSVLAHWMPPSIITFVAPVARTASTSARMPTVSAALIRVDSVPRSSVASQLATPPSRQHSHERRAASAVESGTLLFGTGSLYRSKIT